MCGLARNTLSAYYLALMDSIHPICPDCLLLGEGTGATNLATNWGASLALRHTSAISGPDSPINA